MGRLSSDSKAIPVQAFALAGLLTLILPNANAQTMGASSTSTGSFHIPVTTTGAGRTIYGAGSLNVLNQGGSSVVPSFTFGLPERPKAIIPQPLFQTPKPFEPDLGPFEANR